MPLTLPCGILPENIIMCRFIISFYFPIAIESYIFKLNYNIKKVDTIFIMSTNGFLHWLNQSLNDLSNGGSNDHGNDCKEDVLWYKCDYGVGEDAVYGHISG